MRVAPSIAALRDDDVPQRLAQKSMQTAWNAWRSSPEAARVLKEIKRFGTGGSLESCPSLEKLFTTQGAAESLLDGLVGHVCGAMKQSPLAHPPFRHGFNGHSSTIMLAKSGRAQLLMQAREPGPYDYPGASYTHALRYEAVLAGEAKGRIVRIGGPRRQVRFCDEDVMLRRGSRLAFDCASETMQVDTVTTRLVSLRLEQVASEPEPGREYCRETGNLLHQAAGSLATSRREMMVALLGRMGRKDAAPAMARMALASDDDSLRWQALRECLALDAAEGFTALSQTARTARDGLSEPAGALRAQLVELHPQLLKLEDG